MTRLKPQAPARLYVKEPGNWVQSRDEWALEIGRLMIAFGSIEALTYMALRDLPADPIALPLSGLLLSARIDVLLAILEVRGAEWGRFREMLKEAQSLAAERNLVAHNPVGFDLELEGDGPMKVVASIRSERNVDRHILLEQLRETRQRAEALYSAMINEYEDATPLPPEARGGRP